LYSPPTLYSNNIGTLALSSNVVTLDSAGRATFFCKDALYDAVLASAGPTRVLLDQVGGLVRKGPVVNVLDYLTFQAAHDALPSTGGTMFVPAGTYSLGTAPAFTGLNITNSVALIGEGDGPWLQLSVLVPGS